MSRLAKELRLSKRAIRKPHLEVVFLLHQHPERAHSRIHNAPNHVTTETINGVSK